MSLVIKNMAPEYSNTKAYTEGDFCVNADKPYKCIGDTSGEFDSSKWERCYLSEMMGGGTTVEEFKSIAQEYVSTNEYNEDDVILKDDKLYKCNTDGTTGSWDSDKWDEVLIPDISHNSNLATSNLLWTNSSPTSAFPAQTVSLNLSAYDGVIVEFGDLTFDSRIYITKNDSNAIGCGIYGSSYDSLTRNVTINNSGVTFSNGYVNKSLTNSILKPLKIYGIKGNLIN